MKTRRDTLSAMGWLAGLSIGGLTAFGKSAQPDSPQGKQDNSLEELKNSFSKFKQEYTAFVETVSALSRNIPPVGSIMALAGPIDASHPLPSNFMVCDGTAMKKAEFDTLWKAVDVTYGNGSQQRGTPMTAYDFNLPDLRGYFLRGVDDGAKRDPDINRRVGSSEPEDLKRHAHTFKIPSTDYAIPVGAAPTNGLRFDDFFHKGFAGTFTTDMYPVENELGQETRPLNIAIYWIIRVR